MSCIHIFGHLIRYSILSLMHSPLHIVHMPHSQLHIAHHVIPLSHYTSSHFSHNHITMIQTMIITHHLSHLILLNMLSQYISTHFSVHHHHLNTMTTSHSPADDGRNNSSESSYYVYLYFLRVYPVVLISQIFIPISYHILVARNL